MSSRAVTIAGYVVLGGAALLLVVAGRLGLLARSVAVLDALLARRATQLLLVLLWAWLGWHFLVRTG
jgi:Family of unknown function (DUF6186)